MGRLDELDGQMDRQIDRWRESKIKRIEINILENRYYIYVIT